MRGVRVWADQDVARRGCVLLRWGRVAGLVAVFLLLPA